MVFIFLKAFCNSSINKWSRPASIHCTIPYPPAMCNTLSYDQVEEVITACQVWKFRKCLRELQTRFIMANAWYHPAIFGLPKKYLFLILELVQSFIITFICGYCLVFFRDLWRGKVQRISVIEDLFAASVCSVGNWYMYLLSFKMSLLERLAYDQVNACGKAKPSQCSQASTDFINISSTTISED